MATFAEQMVEKYRTLLADSAGLKSVTVDGQSVAYGELEERLAYWEGRVAAPAALGPALTDGAARLPTHLLGDWAGRSLVRQPGHGRPACRGSALPVFSTLLGIMRRTGDAGGVSG